MNLIERVYTEVAHRIGVYPHDGKEIIYIQNGEFRKGSVIHSTAFTGHVKLTDMDPSDLIKARNKAARKLGVRPAIVQRRLTKGEKIMYRTSE